ncbi:DDE 3 domain containing protein, partial [Asbolus verrucosus]
MQEWLLNHSIDFSQNFSKKQLWDLIKPFRTNRRRYLTDETLRENGHEVLRLPPYHCQYNPIEMAWGFCKSHYNKHI